MFAVTDIQYSDSRLQTAKSSHCLFLLLKDKKCLLCVKVSSWTSLFMVQVHDERVCLSMVHVIALDIQGIFPWGRILTILSHLSYNFDTCRVHFPKKRRLLPKKIIDWIWSTFFFSGSHMGRSITNTGVEFVSAV